MSHEQQLAIARLKLAVWRQEMEDMLCSGFSLDEYTRVSRYIKRLEADVQRLEAQAA